jgi:endonuclease YncB( thermonuclease family)
LYSVRVKSLIALWVLACVVHAEPSKDPLVIGEYKMGRVVDGDTIHVEGLDSSLRLLGFDAEETFKHAGERRAFDAGWEQYKTGVRTKHGVRSLHPVKFATPMGDEAKKWAEKWFTGVETVRLERDDPEEIRDRYNRYLAYVLANKDGAWVTYNVEAVRAGMAPYFPKYGRSRRFDKEFVAAEAEAKKAHRGIWQSGAQAYDDYPERETWWTARGDFVAAFRKDGDGKASFVDLSHEDALDTLKALVGKDVVVLAIVDKVYAGKPTRVMLSHARGSDVPLVFFKADVLAATGLTAWQGEYVRVSGVPSLYKGKLEIVIDHAAQVVASPVPGLTAGQSVSVSADSED